MTIKYSNIILISLLVIGFWVRLYKINNPVADWHSWRQADTAAVTRNWIKTGFNLLSPRYDDFSDVSGNGLFNPSGYRFVEFPIYNVFHYLLATSFPSRPLEYWGRITSILASLISSVLIYSLVKRHVSASCALLACAFYLFLPYNIYFSRVILPDPLMVTLWLGSLLAFDNWTRTPSRLPPLAVSLLLASLAMLVKPMAIFFLLPIVWQAREFISDRRLYVAIFLAAAPILIWRSYSHLHPEGIPASLWLLNGNGIRFRPAWFRWLLGERLGKMFLGSWGVWPFLTGLTSTLPYFAIWGLGALLYVTVFATGNIQHDYYQIPIIPIISILLATGTVKLWQTGFISKLLILICLLLMFGFSWYDLKGNYVVNRWEIVEAGKAVNRLTQQDSVVIAPYLGDTAFLYQTNRQGFAHLPLPVKDLIDRFKAAYYISVNFDAQTKAIMAKYTVIDQNPRFVLVKLVEPKLE